jgi:hypothetical protein
MDDGYKDKYESMEDDAAEVIKSAKKRIQDMEREAIERQLRSQEYFEKLPIYNGSNLTIELTNGDVINDVHLGPDNWITVGCGQFIQLDGWRVLLPISSIQRIVNNDAT